MKCDKCDKCEALSLSFPVSNRYLSFTNQGLTVNISHPAAVRHCTDSLSVDSHYFFFVSIKYKIKISISNASNK